MTILNWNYCSYWKWMYLLTDDYAETIAHTESECIYWLMTILNWKYYSWKWMYLLTDDYTETIAHTESKCIYWLVGDYTETIVILNFMTFLSFHQNNEKRWRIPDRNNYIYYSWLMTMLKSKLHKKILWPSPLPTDWQ